jgi:Protein of unknown function (DUF3105)
VSFALPSRLGCFSRFLRSLSTSTLALSALSGACGSGKEDAPGGICKVVPEADASADTCSIVPKTVTDLARTHVAVCSQVSYPDNPPAGGYHYPVWAAFQSYSFPVPRGFWVHDLEHGAIVFSYNCCASSAGCADEVAQVQALIDGLPADPECSSPTPRRAVLTPDPLLDVRWGVSAWGFTLRADCVDEQSFRQFYLDHFGQGPEDFCDPGSDFGGTPPCH